MAGEVFSADPKGPRDGGLSELTVPSELLPLGFGAIPDPQEDPKSRSPLGFHSLHHRSSRVQNGEIYFLDPPGGLGLSKVPSARMCEVRALHAPSCISTVPYTGTLDILQLATLDSYRFQKLAPKGPNTQM